MSMYSSLLYSIFELSLSPKIKKLDLSTWDDAFGQGGFVK